MIKNAAVISGDIIASTSLSEEDRMMIYQKINDLFQIIDKKFDTFCRITRGDFIECATRESEYSFKIALILKSYLKTIKLSDNPSYKKDNRVKAFKTYGLRIAIGYGKLLKIDRVNKIIDGEAIYMAGRLLNDVHSHDKERITIKRTLNFVSNDDQLNSTFNTIFWSIEELINNATEKQCLVLYHKLLDESESEIARIMNVTQPTVNSHSTRIGWNAIEQAVKYYEGQIRLNNL